MRELAAWAQLPLCLLLVAGRAGRCGAGLRLHEPESALHRLRREFAGCPKASAHTSDVSAIPTVSCRRQSASSSAKAPASKRGAVGQHAQGELQLHSLRRQCQDYAAHSRARCPCSHEAALRVRRVTGATAGPLQQHHGSAQAQTTRYAGRGAFSLPAQAGSATGPACCWRGRGH